MLRASGAGGRADRRRAAWLAVLVSAALVAAAPPPVAAMVYSKARADIWRPDFLASPAGGLAVSPDGAVLYVTAALEDKVYAYSASDGRYLFWFGGGGSGKGRLSDPRGITVDPYGDVYVADTGNARVEKFTRTGAYVRQWDAPLVGQISADDRGDVFVLTGFFGTVQRRTYDGDDNGAWQARFSDGYDRFGLYGPPRTTPAGIAADGDGGALVAADVAQDRGEKEKACADAPTYALAPLPLVLRGPALGRFTGAGTELDQDFMAWLGAPCYSSDYQDSYKLSGSSSATSALTVDPITGDAYAVTRASDGGGQWHIRLMTRGQNGRRYRADDVIGIPDGGQVIDERASYTVFGSIRGIAVDCRRNLFAILDQRLVRYRAPGGVSPACGLRSKATVLLGRAALAGGKGGKPGKLTVPVQCPPLGNECRGIVRLTVSAPKCPRCRTATLARRLRVRPGRSALVAFALGPAVRRLLARGAVAVAGARLAGGARALAPLAPLALQPPSSLSISCRATRAASGALAVSGALGPAGAGRRVTLLVGGPYGRATRLRVRAGRGGRWSAAVATPVPGAWSVEARGAARGRAEASASCGALTGGALRRLPAVQHPGRAGGPPGGPGAPTLTIGCSRTPGDGISASGSLLPAFAGSSVKVSAAPHDPAGGLPAVERTATTTASGGWGASLDVPAGAYDVTVSWAGDVARAAASAGPCAVAS